MCCLFGMIDYGHNYTGKEKAKMMAILGRECEARGTDATGYAYNSKNHLYIYKKPVRARKMKFYVPDEVVAIMGHTRQTTQGSETRNYNNHPFEGHTKDGFFALAHNGVLYNDDILRERLNLPSTYIETDSYIAVQLLERINKLDFGSFRSVAEAVRGSFTFSILDDSDNLWIIKGDNPLCLAHLPKMGLYLYASTEEILAKAVKRMNLPEKPQKVDFDVGDILRIDKAGKVDRETFDASDLILAGFRGYYGSCYGWGGSNSDDAGSRSDIDKEYLEELKCVAAYYGFAPEDIDELLDEGITPEEIEDFLYCYDEEC